MLHRNLTIRLTLLLLLLLPPTIAESIEPYSVKTVYFIPTDSDDKSDWLDLGNIMKNIQEVYRSEMDRHGFPNKTFRLETNNQGNVVVHKFKGRHNKAHYGGSTLSLVREELANSGFDDKRTIYAIVMAGMDRLQFGIAGGVAGAWADGGWLNNGDYYGYCVNVETTREQTEQVLTHEIGHAFGLWHIALYDPVEFIMGSGKKLALHEARWLSKHHYFNHNWQFSIAPKITKFHGAENFGDDNIRFRIDVSDPNGLHQAYLMINSNIIGWDFLEGKQNETADFIDIPRRLLKDGKNVWVYIMDSNGNWRWDTPSFTLPKSRKIEVIEEKDVSKKNPDLKPVDEEKLDDPIDEENNTDNCIHCEIDNEERSVSPQFKLTTSWASIKQRN